MRVLVVGSGGREHALVWKLARDPDVSAVHAAPGNPGMAALATCHPVAAMDIDGQVALARRLEADLVVVGPEDPLAAGLADRLRDAGLSTFGPSAAASRLEASKAWSKDFMVRHNIPTARHGSFTDAADAHAFLDTLSAPFVLKASGLAAGKGVVIADTRAAADAALADMLGGQFGTASSQVVIEEYMAGEEASVFAICDGRDFVILPVCQDHKRAFDGDQGPNTGGMGAYAPAPVVDDALLAQIADTIIAPSVAGMAAEGCPYVGVLYVGVMLTASGPKVVEYNCRFGDPECQVLMPLIGPGFAAGLKSAADGALESAAFAGKGNVIALTVVLAARGYPEAPEKGSVIGGASNDGSGVLVFHAGTSLRDDGALVASGGRVLAVTAVADTFEAARASAYARVATIDAPGLFHRTDIGWREMARRSGTSTRAEG
jgi:phosphoribosylamine--glycine ligase